MSRCRSSFLSGLLEFILIWFIVSLLLELLKLVLGAVWGALAPYVKVSWKKRCTSDRETLQRKHDQLKWNVVHKQHASVEALREDMNAYRSFLYSEEWQQFKSV